MEGSDAVEGQGQAQGRAQGRGQARQGRQGQGQEQGQPAAAALVARAEVTRTGHHRIRALSLTLGTWRSCPPPPTWGWSSS